MGAVRTLRPPGVPLESWQRMQAAFLNVATCAASGANNLTHASWSAMGGDWRKALMRAHIGVEMLERAVGAARSAIAEMEALSR